MRQSVREKKLVHYCHCQRHREGLYNQNMTISTISSKLLVPLQPNLVLWYSIICQSVLRKCLVLGLRSRSQRRLKVSVNICLDDIFWTATYFVTRLGMMIQQNEPECHAEQKIFAVFKVKVTARANMIKIWLWLLYLLNCWFFGNQTLSDDRLS